MWVKHALKLSQFSNTALWKAARSSAELRCDCSVFVVLFLLFCFCLQRHLEIELQTAFELNRRLWSLAEDVHLQPTPAAVAAALCRLRLQHETMPRCNLLL